jgi:hypothetical protein
VQQTLAALNRTDAARVIDMPSPLQPKNIN